MFVTVDDRWLMWFDNQSKLLNSAGEGTASSPEPDGTDFFFDILIYFFSASAASKPNFSHMSFQIFILITLFL